MSEGVKIACIIGVVILLVVAMIITQTAAWLWWAITGILLLVTFSK